VPWAGQQIHQRCVHPGPLVLGTNPLNSPTPATDRDRTVSRRSEPSSRAALMGEQPNPWDLSLPPLLVGQDYTFTMAFSCHHERFRCEPCDRCPIDYLTYLTEATKRCCRGSVVTGDESLDHCRRILTPSSRSDIQSGQCIRPFSHLL